MNSTTPTTELEALNLMLSVIGELPVADLRLADVNADVKMALQLLRSATRAVQVKGWQFNTDLERVLDRLPDGTIPLPSNCVRCVASEVYAMSDVAFSIRGQKLYDRQANSFVWTQDLTCDLTLLLPFEELPEAVRYYIVEKASQRFQSRGMGSETLYAFTREDVADAANVLQDYEIEAGRYNFLTGSQSVLGAWGDR